MRGLQAIILCAGVIALASVTQAADAPRPNIIYLLVDDMGYADCGFNGGKEIQTPAIDALAKTGTVLESFYVQPLCSPTRAALLTGRYPMRYGLQMGVVRPWAKYGLPLEERLLPVALKEAGYKTCITGKWHLGNFDEQYWPHNRGFDHAHGHLLGAIDYFTHHRDGKLDWYRNGKPVEQEGYSTDLIGAEAAEYVRQQNGEKPFFLYVPFNAIHTPHQAPPRYTRPYQQLPKPRQTIAGMLAATDRAVGEIMKAVDEKKLRENTLIIFSSDNGGPGPGRVTDNGPLRGGKGQLWEGGVRVGAFVSWPGKIPADARNSAALHVVDWFPTLLNLAGASTDQPLPLDGKDIWATLTQNAASPHQEILLNSTPRSGALRAGDWKIVVNGQLPEFDAPNANEEENRRLAASGQQVVQLFNLKDDLSEKKNLAESNPEKAAELKKLYDKFAAEAVPPKNLDEVEGGRKED